MAKYKIVYTDAMWALENGAINEDKATIEREVFGDEVELVFGQADNGKFNGSPEAITELCDQADGMVIYRVQMNEQIVDSLKPTVKVIGRQGVGFDNLAYQLLEKNGIFGFNVPDYCVDEVSNHTMSFILGFERKLCYQNEKLKGGYWNIFDGGYPRRIQDLTLGLVGFGRIGKSTGRKATPFFNKIISYDPYIHADQMRGYGVYKSNDLKSFCGEADIVVLHPLLHEETKGMVDKNFFSMMKKDALLVNTARGGLVDPESAYNAIANNEIGGYCSDVFTPEDPNQNEWNKKLLAFDNVLVTSHRAFLSDAAEESQRRRCAEEVLHSLKTGKPPRFGHLTTKLS